MDKNKIYAMYGTSEEEIKQALASRREMPEEKDSTYQGDEGVAGVISLKGKGIDNPNYSGTLADTLGFFGSGSVLFEGNPDPVLRAYECPGGGYAIELGQGRGEEFEKKTGKKVQDFGTPPKSCIPEGKTLKDILRHEGKAFMRSGESLTLMIGDEVIELEE